MSGSRAAGWTRGLALLVSLSATSAQPVTAQGVRGWIGTTVQMVELRTAAGDSLSSAAVNTLAASEDLSLTAWGLGFQGLSATTLLRTRQRRGGDPIWPRSDDAFDALLAYAQILRGSVRLRLGRQEVASGLGFSAFDGGSVDVRLGDARLEAYGGRSLARGLRDPANAALRGLEDFVPDRGVLLLGGAIQARAHGVSSAFRYHREILSDRSALEAERASLDLATTVSSVRLEGSLDYDLGVERLGKGHVTVAAPFGDGRVWVEATARRYVPYFALSTIWGYFDPVPYQELVLRLAGQGTAALGVWAWGGWRRYGDAAATVILSPLDDQGRRGGAGVRWMPDAAWSAEASYALEWGPGGVLSSLDGAVRWAVSTGASVSATLSSFQQFEEFRLGEGRALGAGGAADLAVGDRVSLNVGASVLRHSRGSGSPWNQSRVWTSARVSIGDDPGFRAVSRAEAAP